MPSSHDPVILFLHIPKTAGTTLKTLIYANYAEQHVSAELPGAAPRVEPVYTFWTAGDDGFSIEDALAPPPAHLLKALRDPAVRAVIGHFGFGLHRFVSRPSTYITVLREPVARVVSLYAHEVLWLQDRHRVISDDLSLSEFVSERQIRDVDNGLVRRLCGVDFPFGKCSPKILARAKDNLRRHFSVVGLTERFDETVLLLKKKFDWDEHLFIPKLVNKHRENIVAPTDQVLSEIAAMNQFDAELYRFAEEIFDELVQEMEGDFESELRETQARQKDYVAKFGTRPVNLNSGTSDEFQRLPSIGPVLAQRIVDYRERTGAFERAHQLLEIPGIGKHRYRYIVMLVET
jgi:competence ComEA-like helix-hairpin-helix protein